MTAIAACVDGQKTIWMGGDSAGVSTWGMSTLARRKVFVKSGFLFGCAGSFRMADILEFCFVMPPRVVSQKLEEYYCAELVPALRATFHEHGFARVNEGEEMDASLLVGHQGRICKIQADYALLYRDMPYDAIGCGEDFCIGALHALSADAKLRGDKRISTSLDAAASNSVGVRGPFHVQRLAFSSHR